MRSKPCWSDKLPLEMLYGWIVATAIALGLLLVSECSPTPAHADQGLYVHGSLGATRFQPTVSDGTWRQDGLNRGRETFDTRAFSWRAGLGYNFTEHIGLEAGYFHAGTVRDDLRFVFDRDYAAKAGQCLDNCTNPMRLKVADTYQGLDLAAVYRWHPSEHWSPFVKAGGAILWHRLQADSIGDPDRNQAFYGRIPAALLGSGLCYQMFCAEASYYMGIGGENCHSPCGYPVAKEFLLTTFGVKVPL